MPGCGFGWAFRLLVAAARARIISQFAAPIARTPPRSGWSSEAGGLAESAAARFARRTTIVKLRRFLRQNAIRLDMRTTAVPPGDLPDDFDVDGPKNLKRVRESVAEELVELFSATGVVSNEKRLRKDLFEREKKASTAIGNGIAIPHLRTLQVKDFVMVFARSDEGLPFAAPDDEPVHLFFGMLAPPYDDRTYLKVYRSLAKLLLDPDHFRGFSTAKDANEILRNMELI